MQLSFSSHKIEAGCDEAGRGCLAGPVMAAAVILPRDYHHPKLNDSKKLSEKDRWLLREHIEKHAVSYGVAMIDEREIERINILKASIKAMNESISRLSLEPELLLVDGNRFESYYSIPFECIVKGDAKFASIAAASILAKTYRDEYMIGLSKRYPGYGWDRNKGYATLSHRQAILDLGTTTHHRRTFRLSVQQKLF